MKIKFLSGYDRIKNLVNIMVELKKSNAGKISEDISPKPINPANIKSSISKVINAEVLQKQNKGGN